MRFHHDFTTCDSELSRNPMSCTLLRVLKYFFPQDVRTLVRGLPIRGRGGTNFRPQQEDESRLATEFAKEETFARPSREDVTDASAR